MKDWKDIQNQIREAEEPLSPRGWEDMEAKLGQGQRGRRGWFAGLFILVALLGGWGLFYSSTEDLKEYYQARIILDQENESLATATEAAPAESKGRVGQNLQEIEDENGATASEKAEPASFVEHAEDAVSVSQKSVTVSSKNSEEEWLVPKVMELSLAEKGIDFSGTQLNLLQGEISFSGADSRFPLKKSQQASRLELRFFMASTYNLPSLEYHHREAQTHKQFADAVKDAVQPGWGVDAGFEMRYRLFRNFRISTGFSYREIVTRNNYDFEVSEVPVVDSASGDILAYIPVNEGIHRNETSNNMYSFLNVPVSLYYEQPLAARWTLTGEAINNISFLINQSAYGIDPTSLEIEKNSDEVFNKMINSYQLRLGLRYQLQENFYVALEPAYRKYYQDFFKSEAVSWKPQDFSLSLSAIVKFD